LTCVERIHDEMTLYGDEYIAYGAHHSSIFSNKDRLSIGFQTSQQTAFIALVGRLLLTVDHSASESLNTHNSILGKLAR